MFQTKQEIIKELAEKYNLPKYKVEDVINSYFELAAFTLKNGIIPEQDKFPTVAIPYLGKFYSPVQRRKRWHEVIRTKKPRS